MKDEFGALPVLLVIHPYIFNKMWAVPKKEICWISETLGRPGINSTPFAKFFLNVPSAPTTYDHRDDLGFHNPYPVNFDLQILVLANFFSFFKRDVFIVRDGNINQLTRIGFWSSMTKAVLLVEIFLSVIIESHKMVFSFIFTTLCDVCSYHLLGTSQPNSRHTTQWT